MILPDYPICEWKADGYEYNYWETQCGGAFTLNADTPSDNGMRYCCYCGGKLKVVARGEKE